MSKRYGFADPDSHRYRTSEKKPEPRLCDFCAAREIFRIYPVRDHYVAISQATSTEGWAACLLCAELIDAEKWNVLAERALANFIRQHPEAKENRLELRQLIQELHQGFRDNRTPIH